MGIGWGYRQPSERGIKLAGLKLAPDGMLDKVAGKSLTVNKSGPKVRELQITKKSKGLV